MLLVRPCSLGDVGEIRPGKTLLPVGHNTAKDRFEVNVPDEDTTAIAAVLSMGFVPETSPLAEPRKVAPPPSVEVLVVEREPEPKPPPEKAAPKRKYQTKKKR